MGASAPSSSRRNGSFVVWDATYEVDLGPHVFVTAKYRLTREKLIRDGIAAEHDFIAPAPATGAQLAAVHGSTYLDTIERDGFTMGDRIRLEIPFTAEVRDAMVLACGGTLMTARIALDQGSAAHLGGGFHHAFADHGEGFCLLNDVAVAARALVREGDVERVAVVDLDVHHGNGTAAIFADDPSVFTFSMHQENNYPADKPPSDLDVGLHDGTGDDEYLATLTESLETVFARGRPELVLYLAGADPYRDDQLGGLRLTMSGLRERDRMVFGACSTRGVPVAMVLAGGYAFRLDDTVAIHAGTVEEMLRVAAS